MEELIANIRDLIKSVKDRDWVTVGKDVGLLTTELFGLIAQVIVPSSDHGITVEQCDELKQLTNELQTEVDALRQPQVHIHAGKLTGFDLSKIIQMIQAILALIGNLHPKVVAIAAQTE